MIISPAKILNLKPQKVVTNYTQPEFLKQASVIVDELKHYPPEKLAELLETNFMIAQTNFDRYARWHTPFTRNNAKQSILTFNGEVYNGLKASSLSQEDLSFSQDHLRILSGLYGVLRPLDLMQPYRLPMGTSLSFNGYKDLYDFWRKDITDALVKYFSRSTKKVLVNLASDEYFRSVDRKRLNNVRIIHCEFKEWKAGKYKTIVVYTKKARGLMCRFAIEHRITDPENLKAFDSENYLFEESISSENNWVFVRHK
jgi:cytoplasmic iron level regulating protein YaaA (DUF328/UPF0246 family)